VPTVVTANDGDTLCGLAIDAGFVDCQPLRDEPQNQGKDFLNRPSLKAGDVVVIPDKKIKQHDKSTNTKNVFVKRTAPKVSIRFVHGSRNRPYLQDLTLPALEISNYETNLAGTNGRSPLPAGFGFHPDGDADPDSFKVEVVDPAAGGSVTVVLEALKPVYKPDSSIDHHEEFSGAQAANRKVNCGLQQSKFRCGLPIQVFTIGE
jgi:hypothetical protein